MTRHLANDSFTDKCSLARCLVFIFSAIFSFVLVPAAQAQVRVVDSVPQSGRSGNQSTLSVSVQNDALSQMSSMQEEITLLRGMLEEQAHEIKQLKQLQLDNYIDLDRRLSNMRQSGQMIDGSTSVSQSLASSNVIHDSPSSTANIPPTVMLPDSASENDLYKAAYDLLNQKNFDGATAAFKEHLSRFPNGSFASNSHYWLGKIAMLRKDYSQAKEWFTKLIASFPSAPKVPDAQLDLGKVYFYMGDKTKSKALLNEVAAGSSDAAKLAKKFIADNF
jgi:tol-pal system protein YbgF